MAWTKDKQSLKDIKHIAEDEESSDDYLDITRTTQKQLSQYIYEISQPSAELSVALPQSKLEKDEDETTEGITEVRKEQDRARSHREALSSSASPIRISDDEQIDFTDEEDPKAAYRNFKARKSLKRKRVAAETKKAKAAISGRGAKTTSIVGRKAQRTQKAKNEVAENPKRTGRSDASGTDEQGSADENTVLEDSIPDYVKKRRAEIDKLHNAGWRFPPKYDDVEFSDEEALLGIGEKPDFANHKGVKTQREKKDIRFPKFKGVIPASIAQWLRDYQVEGLQFLHEVFVMQKGAILGDDMGLGKTIQVIAFLTAAFGKSGTKSDAKRMRKIRRIDDGRWYPRVLIICPGGLMQNWQDELERWGWWQVYVYHGSSSEKDAALQAARQGRLEIMITTYTTYRLNKGVLNTVEWDCIIADECHTIKSRDAEITKAMNDANALCRIGLTGTAIQNKYEELWALLNWARPGHFGTLSTWKQSISIPLKVGQAHDATHEQLGKARKTADDLVKRILPGVFLRRMKTLIADQLPKKSDRVVFCSLTDTQALAYQNFVESEMVEYIRDSSDPCECNSGKKRGWCCHMELPNGRGMWSNHAFPCMVTLQKLSNHLALLLPASSDPAEKRAKDLENLQIALPERWKNLYRDKDRILSLSTRDFCGKWKVLKRLLDFWHTNGDKVLVFSHSVRLLRLLKALFDIDGTKYNFSYLDGSMTYDDRAKTVADFNADPNQFVFLISTRAGGVGLNITSANKVVVVDPNWNPAYDLQAQDRAYRIGQTRDVEVFRLVSAGTIEEIVYARQIYKQQQANIGYTASLERRYFKGVMDESQKKGELFGLKNLFSFDNNGHLLRDIFHKTNVAEVKAGVSVIEFNETQNESEDDDEEEDSVLDDDVLGIADDESMDSLSQMKKVADAITRGDRKGGRKKFIKRKRPDPVNAILEKAGVQYTHENSEVIGESKVEEHLSRKAMQLSRDLEWSSKKVFEQSQNQHQVRRIQSEDEEADSGRDSDIDEITYRYKPPEDVRRRQFCEIARMQGYDDPIEFALVVESMTQKERRTLLEKFYRRRRKMIFEGGDEKR